MGGELEISALWCRTRVPPVGTCRGQWVENLILLVWGPGQRSLCGARGHCEGLWLGTPHPLLPPWPWRLPLQRCPQRVT